MRFPIILLGGLSAVVTACGGGADSPSATPNADIHEGRTLVQAISDASTQTTTVHVDVWSKNNSRLLLGDGDELRVVFSDGVERMLVPSDQSFIASRNNLVGSFRVVLRRGATEVLIAAVEMPNTVLRVPETVRFGEPVQVRLDPPPSAHSGIVKVNAGASGPCVRLHDTIRFDDKGEGLFTAFGAELGKPACAIQFGVEILGDTGKAATSLGRAETLWVVRRTAITAAYE